MVRPTNTNKRYVIKVGYYWGPWPTPEQDQDVDEEHWELKEEGRATNIIRSEELVTSTTSQIKYKTTTESQTYLHIQ